MLSRRLETILFNALKKFSRGRFVRARMRAWWQPSLPQPCRLCGKVISGPSVVWTMQGFKSIAAYHPKCAPAHYWLYGILFARLSADEIEELIQKLLLDRGTLLESAGWLAILQAAENDVPHRFPPGQLSELQRRLLVRNQAMAGLEIINREFSVV